jgi:signal transduction histidine kinase
VIATAIQEGDRIRLELSDNGAGISPQTLGRVFLPFFTTKNHGTGLGLALVHRIVTEHGGTITAASDGSGATFTLSLPAKKPAQAASESH